MQVYLEARGEEIWDVVENDSYIDNTVINDVKQVKVKGSGIIMTRRKSYLTRR